METIAEALAEGAVVRLKGFGAWTTRSIGARTMHNMNDMNAGLSLLLPPCRRFVVFHFSRALKDAVR